MVHVHTVYDGYRMIDMETEHAVKQ